MRDLSLSQVGKLKLVVRVLTEPPDDAHLDFAPGEWKKATQTAAKARKHAAEELHRLNSLESEGSQKGSDLAGGAAAAAGPVNSAKSGRRDKYVTDWWHEVTGAAKAAGGAGGRSNGAEKTAQLLRSRNRAPKFIARVYALEGRGLKGKDLNGKCDPYIRARVKK